MNADRVVRRSLVLAAVVCRGSLDSHSDESEALLLHIRLLTWLTEQELWKEMEPNETRLLSAPLGTWEQAEILGATWRVEGLAILAWALQQSPFPQHDQCVDPYATADAVWFLSADVEEFLRTAALRPVTELAACREVLYAVHVRLRDALRNGGKKDFSAWVEKEWLDVLGLEAAPLLAGNDLAIDGKPIYEAATDRIAACSHILHERQRAILWVVEGYPSFAQTPVDT